MLVFLWMSQGMYGCAQEGGLPANAHTLSESERDKEKGKCTSFTGQWQKWSQPGLVLHCSHLCSWCLNPRMTANKAGTEYRFAHSAAVEAQFFLPTGHPLFLSLGSSGKNYSASAAVGTNP